MIIYENLSRKTNINFLKREILSSVHFLLVFFYEEALKEETC